MRILMVVGQFYPVIGGAERQCLKLSKALKARGHQIQVLTAWNPRNVPHTEQVEGISVERVWYPILSVFEHRVGLGFLVPVFLFWCVYRTARAYDVIHVHQCLWPAFAAAIAARLRKKPIVCKLGNSGKRFDLKVLQRTHIYGRFAVWYMKKYIANFIWTSKAVLDDLAHEGIGKEKLAGIPNGVELPPTSISPLEGGGKEGVKFIFTGTFTAKKNLLALIEAIRILPEQYRTRMKLILLGDGPDRDALTEVVRHYNLDSVVEICGPVDKVDPYLESSDVFVLPSTTEGLSNSALEAMAHGLSVLLSNRGGNRDLVDGNGLLIDPDDIGSLRGALQFIIDHHEERKKMGERSRQLIEQRYSMDHVVLQYENLYRSCISSHVP